jgi:HK97 family phage prohead protease
VTTRFVSKEVRTAPLEDVDLRVDAKGLTFEGYAAVFGSVAQLGPFRERIASGAFRKTINDGADVRFLVEHEGVPLARTKSGTLRLVEDERGLRVAAVLDPRNPKVQELRSAVSRGDLDQMSFAFASVDDVWDEGGELPLRTLREVKLFDVSAVAYPAYEETTAQLRSATRHLETLARAQGIRIPPDPSAELERLRIRSASRRRLAEI